MNREAYGSLFTLFGGFNAFFAVSVMIVVQGGFGISDLPGLEPTGKIISSYFAIVIVGGMLFLTAVCGIGFAVKAASGDILLPKIGLGEKGVYSPCSVGGVIYQLAVILFVLLVPSFVVGHLNRQVLAQGVIWNEKLPAGTSLPAGCFFPDIWASMFGRCELASKPAAAVADIVKAHDGRYWLSNHWCDIYYEQDMAGPQVKARADGCTGDGLSSSESEARQRLSNSQVPSAGTLLTFSLGRTNGAMPDQCQKSYWTFCSGKRDISAMCKNDPTRCRGVEWVNISAPLVIGISVAGWVAMLACLAVFGRGLRARCREEREAAKGAAMSEVMRTGM